MKRELKPEINKNNLGVNPLTVNDLEIKVVEKVYTGSFKHKDGDIIHNTGLIEYDSCTKVYNKASNRLFASKLTAGSKSLLLWLIFEMDYNEDYIWINKTRYMEENDISSINTYKKAITELTRYCVIYPMLGKRNVYWINPRLMFNGNRITKYPDSVIKINT